MHVDNSDMPRHTQIIQITFLSDMTAHDEYIEKLQKIVFGHTQSNFTEDFIDSEIHA